MLKGKNILVTGGSKRVGKAISLRLAQAGANIFITYGNDAISAENTITEIEKTGVKSKAYKLDLANMTSIKLLAESLLADCGNIYGLVNNAAIFYRTPIFELSEKDYNHFMDTNLKGPFFLAQYLGRHMFDNGEGRIVNIADVSGEKIWPDYLPYCLSKSGVISMTRGLAKALAPNVLVNAVSPGTVLLAEEYDEKEENALIERTPLKRIGKPEDISSAVFFLMDSAEFVNGQVINVDGGRSLV